MPLGLGGKDGRAVGSWHLPRTFSSPSPHLPGTCPADLDYARTANVKFTGEAFKKNSFVGETHNGFTDIFQAVWPGVQAALNSEVLGSDKKTGIKNVLFAGHSLGASVASLLSYAVSGRAGLMWGGVVGGRGLGARGKGAAGQVGKAVWPGVQSALKTAVVGSDKDDGGGE